MATHEAWGAMRVRTAIGAALAAGAMVLAGPAGIAVADDPVIDYQNKVKAALDQFNQAQAAQNGQITREQWATEILQITTATQQLQDAQGIAGR
jgi:hypothetical protein